MKKLIIPIVIGVISTTVFISYAMLIMQAAEGFLFMYIIALGALACSVAMVFVVVQRIKEIKEGEYDDLSKY